MAPASIYCTPGNPICSLKIPSDITVVLGSATPAYPDATSSIFTLSPSDISSAFTTSVIPSPSSSSSSTISFDLSPVNPSSSSLVASSTSSIVHNLGASAPAIGALSDGAFLGIVLGGLGIIIAFIAMMLFIRHRRWRAGYIRKDETNRTSQELVLPNEPQPSIPSCAFDDKESIHQVATSHISINHSTRNQRPLTASSYNPPQSPPPAYSAQTLGLV